MNRYHQTRDQLQKESQVIEQAKKDPRVFGFLYEKYYRQIFVFVFRRTGNEDLAGDLVSEAFLKAMVALPKFEFKGLPFSSWLFRIALNEVNMYYRKTTKDRVISLDKTDLGKMIADSGEKETEENQQLVMKLLSQLETDEMLLIELRYFENRPFAEIADIIGITENNAKVKTYRILDKLKKLLDKNPEQ